MEIKNLQLNSISAYKKISKPFAAKKGESASRVSANTDKVEFDFGRSLSAAKAAAAAYVDSDAGEERLAALAAKYADGNCPVSADAVAGAMTA